MTTCGHLMLASLAGTRSASSEFFLQARAEVQVRGLQRGGGRSGDRRKIKKRQVNGVPEALGGSKRSLPEWLWSREKQHVSPGKIQA